MGENTQDNNRAFQTSARSRKRVIKSKPWLTVILLLVLLAIGCAMFFVVRYTVRNVLPSSQATNAVSYNWGTELPADFAETGDVLTAEAAV